MDGARDDLGIRAAPATHVDVVPADSESSAGHSLQPVFVKPAGEDDWLPLAAGAPA